uniref:Uncharacterized protein n=1 Tax=Arundo donax TaxID=35708 RepID=A0A0A9GDV3_ARUDO
MKTFGKGFTNCGKRKGISTENCPLSYSNFCDHLIVAKTSSPPPTCGIVKGNSSCFKRPPLSGFAIFAGLLSSTSIT